MKLPEFQQQFRNWMKHPEDFNLPPGFLADGLNRLPMREKVQIYINDYHFRMVEALSDTFGCIRCILSDDEFIEMVRRFGQAHPSGSHDLGNFGAPMAAFLEKDALTQARPFLPDLARAEWALTQAFHSEWLSPVSADDLAELDEASWPQAIFQLQPSLRLLQSIWPLGRMLHVTSMSDEELQNFDLQPLDPPGACLCLVQMPGGQVNWRSVTAAESALLTALSLGKSFGEACEASLGEEDVPHLQSWFGQWRADGLIIKIN